MRMTTKLIPVLLLGSTLSACSMAGTGDYFADNYSHMQQQQLPHIYGPAAGCAYTGCASSYPVAQPSYQTPSHHAYGQSVQGHAGYGHQGVPAYHGPSAHQGYGLRGPKAGKQSYTYGTLGAVMYDVDSDLFGAQARLGWQSASIFGAEVEGSLGFSDDDATFDVGGTNFAGEAGIDNQIAGFGVARLPVSPKLNVLGRVGYHNTELSGEYLDGAGVETELDYSTDGIAYGAGVEYAMGPRTSLRADYTRYDFDGADADSVSLGVLRKF